MLLFVLSLCGFAGGLTTRLLDPLLTSIAADFSTTVGFVALLSSAFSLPYGLSQPILGPLGDSFGKATLIKGSAVLLMLCLIASTLAPDLTTLFLSRVLAGIAAGGIMPVCMALVGDRFPLAMRQLALSRFVGANLIGQLVGAAAGGLVAEWVGWRGSLAIAAAVAGLAAAASLMMLPEERKSTPSQLSLSGSVARYRLVLRNPRSIVCFGIVFLEGLAIYGILPFIGDLLRSRGAGGLREAGFVIGGFGFGGILFATTIPIILGLAKRPALMAVGGAVAAVGLAGVGLNVSWVVQMLFMVVLGFGFFLLHNSVQTEVTELAPSARASAFSLHAFSFGMGQALGPPVYGVTLPVAGPQTSLTLGALVLVAVGVTARHLLGSKRRTASEGDIAGG